jgi:hypothetical protein
VMQARQARRKQRTVERRRLVAAAQPAGCRLRRAMRYSRGAMQARRNTTPAKSCTPDANPKARAAHLTVVLSRKWM